MFYNNSGKICLKANPVTYADKYYQPYFGLYVSLLIHGLFAVALISMRHELPSPIKTPQFVEVTTFNLKKNEKEELFAAPTLPKQAPMPDAPPQKKSGWAVVQRAVKQGKSPTSPTPGIFSAEKDYIDPNDISSDGIANTTYGEQESPGEAGAVHGNTDDPNALGLGGAGASGDGDGSGAVSDAELWNEYGSALQKLCERNKRYPVQAAQRGWQGKVEVLIQFSVSGAYHIGVQESCGHRILDNQAMEMVRKSAEELPVPQKYQGRAFKILIPIEFILDN